MAGQMTLLVPVRIDGLYVDSEGQEFGSPMADFSILPYNLSDGSTKNNDEPNLAETAFGQSNPLAFPKGRISTGRCPMR
jgi:hypothetical protein